MDRADSRHLTFGLDKACKHCSPEVRPVANKVEVSLFLLQMLRLDLCLDEVELCYHIRIRNVAVSMEKREVTKTLISSIVVTQPSWTLLCRQRSVLVIEYLIINKPQETSRSSYPGKERE